MAPETDRLLYHYTTAAGLMGIVKTGEIWATDAYYLNDSKEVIGTLTETKKLISEVLGASQTGIPDLSLRR